MTQKTRLTVEENTCRVISVCQDPEPPCLTYLRGRWLEDHSREAFDSGSSDEEEVNPLLLNPTQWKDQDHYAILGLGKLRYRATVKDLKKAYRQKVLAHHPDKQTEEQQKDGDDRFKCIKIAYDILWNPKKRRSYDSVDPTFDDIVPPICSASRENFFATFGPVIADNARWSTRQPVPLLGDDDSSVDDVDAFYSFWFNFDSWREYSYQDEENAEKGECREERRWIEKQNKAVRQKKKKEEMARLRLLVDNVYNCDPRVKKFKEAEKAEKEAKKKAKVEAARKETAQRKAEERRKLEEDRMVKEREEEAAKAQAAQLKKEKEAVKKAFRKERKNIRATCKEHNYFALDDTDLVSRLQDMDKICTSLSLEQLQQLNATLTRDKPFSEAKALFEAQVAELDKQEQAKLRENISATSSQSVGSSAERDSNWSTEETQLLVKAVNLFPAGTVRRWETVADFINTHSGEGSREKDARMVISKVKNLKKFEADQKDSLNKQAFSHFEQQHQTRDKGRALEEQPQAMPSERYDNPAPWTAEEQRLLEQALRAHPTSVGPDRWKHIAEAVGTRNKEECVARFKELVARVKAKKQSTQK